MGQLAHFLTLCHGLQVSRAPEAPSDQPSISIEKYWAARSPVSLSVHRSQWHSGVIGNRVDEVCSSPCSNTRRLLGQVGPASIDYPMCRLQLYFDRQNSARISCRKGHESDSQSSARLWLNLIAWLDGPPAKPGLHPTSRCLLSQKSFHMLLLSHLGSTETILLVRLASQFQCSILRRSKDSTSSMNSLIVVRPWLHRNIGNRCSARWRSSTCYPLPRHPA